MTSALPRYPFGLLGQDQPYTILNSSNLTEIAPKSFHLTKDPYRADRLTSLQTNALKYFTANQQVETFCHRPPDDGLQDLNISGSAQFTYLGFNWILDKIQNPKDKPFSLINIDLREESHCFFKGVPLSNYIPGNCLNFGIANIDIEERERQWIDCLKTQSQIQVKTVLEKSNGLFKNIDTLILDNQDSEDIISERNYIEKSQGFKYIRIPIGDHTKPTEEDMVDICTLFSKIDTSQWLHFHCAGGKGRTTTLMLLYDIFVNHQRYPNLTIEDYVLRHYLIGGTNLFSCPEIQWKMKSTFERAQFIRHFHKKFYSL